MRTTSPLSFSSQPCASTSCSFVKWFDCIATSLIERLEAFGVFRQSVQTALLLRVSLGLSGNPPFPVTVKELFALLPPAGQVCATNPEASTNSAGKVVNPRLGSTSRVLICTVPFTPKSELAVMSLFEVGRDRNWVPKIPEVMMLIFPPRPLKALAVISLFSAGTPTMNLALMSIFPPSPPACAVPDVVEMLLLRRSNNKSCTRNLIFPPSPDAVWALRVASLSSRIERESISSSPAFPNP